MVVIRRVDANGDGHLISSKTSDLEFGRRNHRTLVLAVEPDVAVDEVTQPDGLTLGPPPVRMPSVLPSPG